MRRTLACALAAACVALLSGTFAYAGTYGIIVPDKPSKTVQHAGTELRKYVRQMTHSQVAMGESAGEMDTVFLLGDANPAAKKLSVQAPANWSTEKSTDAYYLKSTRSGGRNYVRLAGKSDAGILYAVYEYLERYGGCGFFQDGDYVPSKAPKVTAIDYSTSPRFSFRMYRGDVCGSFGLKKYDWLHRNMDDWIPFYDWLAKRRINVSDYWPLMYANAGGVALEMAFGVKDETPGERYGTGQYTWPNAYTWPAQYRTQMLQHRLAYHRMLGIKALIQRMYSHVPIRYKQAHPEYKYIDVGYGHAVLDPNQPIAYELMEKYCKALVDIYGTDHLWDDWPYAESPADADYDKGLQLKIKAAQDAMKTYKAADPDAVWVTDSWDIVGLPAFWTPERRQKFFEAVPRDHMLMADACVDINTTYKKCNYFYGTPWALGVIHTFQGDDHLHGNLQALLDTVQTAVNDPKSDQLVGYGHFPESHGSNMMYWQFSTELAWNPKGVTLDGFVSDYTRTRYGDESYRTMLQAQKDIVQAVYTGKGQNYVYKGGGYSIGAHQLNGTGDIIKTLKKGIDLALTQEQAQKDNKLYENDMVEWSKSYLGHLVNYSTTAAQKAFDEHDYARMRQFCELARKCLWDIEYILSTRPDYYLQNTIDQAMSVPGANPATPKMIRVHCIFALYSANDVYEEMHVFYRPRLEKYLDLMEEAAAKGSKEIDQTALKDSFSALQSQWIEGKFEIPSSAKFQGTTLEAVRKAMADVEPAVRRLSVNHGWKGQTALSTTCAPTPVVNGLEVIPWPNGASKVVDYEGSSCWALGPKSAESPEFLYVRADDSLACDVNGPATLTVEYFDEGESKVWLHYDSTDDKAEWGGLYKYLRAFALTNTRQWKTADILIPDARFASRENGGSDFRLYMGAGSLHVRKLSLSPGRPKSLPVQVP